jgi:hypothetical protein
MARKDALLNIDIRANEEPVPLKVLDVSTIHIRKESCCWLHNDNNHMYVNEYGWVVNTSKVEELDEDLARWDAPPIPAEIRIILEWAYEKDFNYVMFDEDGPCYEIFEQFDW